MKIILPLFLVLLLSACSSKPREQFVFDNEQILTDEQEEELTTLLKEHEKKTDNEIVLVTTAGWGEHHDIFDYIDNFIEENRIGKNKNGNDIVILYSNQQHATVISTGSNIKHVLTDEVGKDIVERLMIPKFNEGNYFEGLYEGSKAVVDFIEEEKNIVSNSEE
ncbi:MAG: TPM domain-containing protein [Crocinitomicaceae bacterium]